MDHSVSTRHDQIRTEVARNPLVLDEELARQLNVSIHTIRLDRRKIGIPEVRRRSQNPSLFPATTYTCFESCAEMLELTIDHEAIALFCTDDRMCNRPGGPVREGILFDFAASLARASVPPEFVFIGEVNLKIFSPVIPGDKVFARSGVKLAQIQKREVQIVLKTGNRPVADCYYTLFCVEPSAAQNLYLDHEGK